MGNRVKKISHQCHGLLHWLPEGTEREREGRVIKQAKDGGRITATRQGFTWSAVVDAWGVEGGSGFKDLQ